MTKVIT